MGMTAKIEIADKNAKKEDVDEIIRYFHKIDERFSTYKKTSEIERINTGIIKNSEYSIEMKKILSLCEETEKETNGYFTAKINGKLDPSGIVKGYALWQAGKLLKKLGYKNYFVEIGGDIEICGFCKNSKKWKVGIQNPFDTKEIVKVVYLTNKGIATSGNYIRGSHIINPISGRKANDIASTTVIGPNIYDADRFATAAFAMGEKGIFFIESLKGFEGYMIKNDKKAVFTSGFEKYLTN